MILRSSSRELFAEAFAFDAAKFARARTRACEIKKITAVTPMTRRALKAEIFFFTDDHSHFPRCRICAFFTSFFIPPVLSIFDGQPRSWLIFIRTINVYTV